MSGEKGKEAVGKAEDPLIAQLWLLKKLVSSLHVIPTQLSFSLTDERTLLISLFLFLLPTFRFVHGKALRPNLGRSLGALA